MRNNHRRTDFDHVWIDYNYVGQGSDAASLRGDNRLFYNVKGRDGTSSTITVDQTSRCPASFNSIENLVIQGASRPR